MTKLITILILLQSSLVLCAKPNSPNEVQRLVSELFSDKKIHRVGAANQLATMGSDVVKFIDPRSWDCTKQLQKTPDKPGPKCQYYNHAVRRAVTILGGIAGRESRTCRDGCAAKTALCQLTACAGAVKLPYLSKSNTLSAKEIQERALDAFEKAMLIPDSFRLSQKDRQIQSTKKYRVFIRRGCTELSESAVCSYGIYAFDQKNQDAAVQKLLFYDEGNPGAGASVKRVDDGAGDQIVLLFKVPKAQAKQGNTRVFMAFDVKKDLTPICQFATDKVELSLENSWQNWIKIDSKNCSFKTEDPLVKDQIKISAVKLSL